MKAPFHDVSADVLLRLVFNLMRGFSFFLSGKNSKTFISERLKLEKEGVYFPCPKTMPPSAKVNFHPCTRRDTPTHLIVRFRKLFVIGPRVELTKNNSKIGIRQNIELFMIFMSFMDGIIALLPLL